MVYEERRHDRDEMQHTGGVLMLNEDIILIIILSWCACFKQYVL